MKKSKVLGVITSAYASLFLASAAFAIDTNQYLPDNPIAQSNLMVWIKNVLNIVIGLAALVCVAILIASGYMYITASGDETKVEKATKSLTGAIIGLVICFISVILVQFVLDKVINQK